MAINLQQPTGGSAGIGKAIATLLNRDGAQVALIARTLSRLEAAKSDMPHPDLCLVVAGDVSTTDGVTAAITEAVCPWR